MGDDGILNFMPDQQRPEERTIPQSGMSGHKIHFFANLIQIVDTGTLEAILELCAATTSALEVDVFISFNTRPLNLCDSGFRTSRR